MTSKIDIFASAILYCSVNNRDAVMTHIGAVHDQFQSHFRSYEIIIVNNTGRDLDTALLQNYDGITVLNLSHIHGREQAMTAGADLAIGDFLYEFDYMPTHLPDDILMKMQNQAFDECADIVVAKNTSQTPWTSKLFYFMLHKFGLTDIPMGTDLIRLISRRALNIVLKERRSFRFRKLLYAQSGFQSSVVQDQTLKVFLENESRARLDLASDVITSFSKVGSSIAKLLALFFLIVTGLIAIYAVVVKLSGLPIAEGWTTMMLFLCMAFSGIFIILSILSRTAELILLELQNAHPYRVRDITKIESSSPSASA